MKKNLLFFVIIVINILLLGITFFANVYEFPGDREINNINYDVVDFFKLIFGFLSFLNLTYLFFNFIKSKMLNVKNLIIFLLFIICLVELIRMMWLSSGLIGE